MKKIVNSLLILISIFLFQQIIFAENNSEADLLYNIQIAKSENKKVKAEKELFYYYTNVKYYEQVTSLANELLDHKLSKKSKYSVYYNTANAYLKLKKYELAVEMAQEAEYLYPKKLEIKLLLGNIYKDNNLHELAITQFNECLDLDYNNIEALIKLGEIYNLQENYKTSLDYYKKAEKQTTNLSITDYINMAISAKEIGLIEQAQDILENIKDRNKKASLLLVSIYRSKQEFDKAIKELTPFVYKEDTDIEIYCNLAQLYLLSKKYNEAKELLLYFKSKNENENFESIDLLMVEALYNIHGDKQKALNTLQKIYSYTKSTSIKTMIEKTITFEKNIQ